MTNFLVVNPGVGSRLDLSWANPAGGVAGVVILRRVGGAVTDAPVPGQSYVPGATVGSSTVVYAAAGTSHQDTGLVNGTTYHYKAFAHDTARNYASGVTGNGTPTAASTGCPSLITIDNRAAGQPGPSGPGEVGFTGTWIASAAPAPFGANSLYSNGAGLDTYFWRTAVLNAGAACTYRVEVWWTQHANRSTTVPLTVSGQSSGPAQPQVVNQRLNGGKWNSLGIYTFPAGARGTVQVTDQNGQAAADAVQFVLATTPATANVTNFLVVNPGVGSRLDLSWANPAGGVAGVVILRRVGGAVTDAPVPGQSYVPGATVGSSTVVYAAAGTSHQDTGLVNGTTYHYKAFAHDTARNYASGVTGNGTPTAASTGCPSLITIDNRAAGQPGPSGPGEVGFTGTWIASAAPAPFGANSLYSNGAGLDTYFWRTAVLNAGAACTYRVEVWWTQHANRSTTVPLTVSGQSSGPAQPQVVNQRLNGGKWNSLGIYTFPAGARGTVQVTDQNGQAAADAVQFVLATP